MSRSARRSGSGGAAAESNGRFGRRSVLRGSVTALGVTLSVALILIAAGVGYALVRFSDVERHDVALAETTLAGEPRNWLIVGSDSRANIDAGEEGSDAFIGGGVDRISQRADSIGIVRVDPKNGRLDLISIPRDLWVTRPDGKKNRINTAYSLDNGRQMLIDTISSELGIDIHHYAEIDFLAFQDLVAAVDGVPLWFDSRMRDQGSGLFVPAKGCYTLRGDDALKFVRARHLEVSNGVDWVPDPTGDLGRITRQQVFLERSFHRAREQVTGLGGPKSVMDMIDAATRNVGLDTTLTLDDLLDLAQRFSQVEDEALRIHSLPVENFRTAGGAAVVRVIPEEVNPILAVFGGGIDTSVKPDEVSLTVLNGTGAPHQASDVSDALKAVGFKVLGIGDDDATEPLPRTEVRYGEGSEEAADLVSRHLTNRATLVPDDSLADGRVVLVTGLDFTTVQRVPHPADPKESAPTSTAVPPTTWGVKPGEPPPGASCG